MTGNPGICWHNGKEKERRKTEHDGGQKQRARCEMRKSQGEGAKGRWHLLLGLGAPEPWKAPHLASAGCPSVVSASE